MARHVAKSDATINNLVETDRLRSGFIGSAKLTGATPEEIRLQRMREMTAGRLGDPDEFGATCAFLCSKHTDYINGLNVLMDSGAFSGTF